MRDYERQAAAPPRGGVRPLGDEGEARTARRNPLDLRLRFAQGMESVSLRLRGEPQRGLLWSPIIIAWVLDNLRLTFDLGWVRICLIAMRYLPAEASRERAVNGSARSYVAAVRYNVRDQVRGNHRLRE